MSRPVVQTHDADACALTDAAPPDRPERALALAVLHQAIVDLTTRPGRLHAADRRRRFLRMRHGAARFLVGCPTVERDAGSYREMRALWCGIADVRPDALEALVWREHGALLRYVLDHPPETPRSKWRELLRRRRHGRMLRRQRAAA